MSNPEKFAALTAATLNRILAEAEALDGDPFDLLTLAASVAAGIIYATTERGLARDGALNAVIGTMREMVRNAT